MRTGIHAGMGLRTLLLSALLALAGCATGPNANPNDPLEPLNREVSKFNEGVDAVILKPGATLYREKVPPLVRTGVSNFFGNLGDAWSAINSALQFKFQNAAENWMRFSTNTFLGLGGILDIASDFNIERHREDFGQTLGHWGVPAGPYIVLPLLGPSTLRDTLVLPIDRRGDPVRDLNHASERNTLYVLRAVDIRANLLRASDVLEGAALDRYSFIRDSYLQRRRAEIGTRSGPVDNDGQEPEEDSGEAKQSPGGAPTGSTPGVPVPSPAPSR
ncbi:VacJ family lipoprotein [Ramlibacter henchirensis]|uniref:VacJ family lipoprotein n=1 Tax=Ramlibacter henchirensis TaxID=204072 RepID=A0A4Z0C7R5_9BURK|nr:VacJ family lipoprotein [Ramlibacter henchirensis]TFZ07321.1 VacJ family lipoprotein [Ramlibacter henchirensis]